MTSDPEIVDPAGVWKKYFVEQIDGLPTRTF